MKKKRKIQSPIKLLVIFLSLIITISCSNANEEKDEKRYESPEFLGISLGVSKEKIKEKLKEYNCKDKYIAKTEEDKKLDFSLFECQTNHPVVKTLAILLYNNKVWRVFYEFKGKVEDLEDAHKGVLGKFKGELKEEKIKSLSSASQFFKNCHSRFSKAGMECKSSSVIRGSFIVEYISVEELPVTIELVDLEILDEIQGIYKKIEIERNLKKTEKFKF